MGKNRWQKHVIPFLLGIIFILLFAFLTGATSVSQIGRYRMFAIQRRGFAELYVIDTTNGDIKYVDSKFEGKPFDQLK